MNLIQELWKQLEYLKSSIETRIQNFGAQYQAFGIFGLINYPFFYIIWKAYGKTSYENFPLRLIITFLSSLLLLREYWPKILKPWLPVYWYITLFISLPFFFFFMTFMNQGAEIWLMSSNTVLFWLGFMVEPASYLFILFGGIFFAWLAYFLVSPNPTFGIERWWGAGIQFFASFLVANFFSRKKYQFNEKKLHAMQALATSLAHEIRTPLASLSASIEGIKPYWNTLVNGYQIAKLFNTNIALIPSSQLNLLKKTIHRMQREVDFTNTIINMLLVNVSLGTLKTEHMNLCSVNACVEQALQRYPFSQTERHLVNHDSSTNFFFKGNDILLIHVLFNLIKNALYHIKAANKGSIRIWSTETMQHHQLHFMDTGTGISPKLMPHIFEHFFSKTYHGSGIGLTFCKAVMESFLGSIECYSVEKEYVEFILNFPKML